MNTDLDDIHSELVSLRASVEASSESRKFVIVWWLLLLFGWTLAGGIFSDVWHSKTRYVIQYGVNYNQITMQSRPHDCSFLHAPLGDKGCHYEINVTETQGQKDGTTDMEKQVYIYWERVEE